MANTQIAISKNGKTILATAGKYCERDIDINVSVASAGDNIPSYVKAEADSLALKVASAQGNKVFTLAAITDLHYGNGNYTNGILHASQALSYINKQITLDAFAVLGDYTDGYPIDNVDNAFGDCRKINSLLAPMEGVPNLRIQGNHDFYSGYAQFVHYNIQAYSEGVTWGDKIGGYFYRDFSDKKLRIICVNTTETDNANLTVSDTQYNWFISALDLSAKSDASDWQILILSHHPLDWYSSSYVFCYILEAYKSGGSWSSGNISCNFVGKNAATLIGNIHGHIHNLLTDYINKGNVVNPNPTKVLRIATPEACINRANQYDGAWKDTATYNKTTNSANDTSFIIYCIDLNAQNIKAFCYGAGYDREISYAPILPAMYNITNNLTNCTASGASTIIENGTAAITIVANDEYELPDTINVSGASYTWDKSTGTVILSNPISDVTITVVAIKIPVNYTNQIPLSINADGTAYIGTNGEKGYKTGYRLNSSGVETSLTDWEVTGFIPFNRTDVFYFKNIQWCGGDSPNNDYIGLYDANFTKITSTKIISEWLVSKDAAFYGITLDADNNIISIDCNKWCIGGYGSLVNAQWDSVKYIRFSLYDVTNDSIITINEPIGDTPDVPVVPTVYNITNNLTNCTASGASTITKNGTATINISANNGYELPDVITVSGANYTWDKSTGTITLSNPTDNVIITVIAVKTEIKPSYTNQVLNSVENDGVTPYNGGLRYKTNTRYNSSCAEAEFDSIISGYIPYNSNVKVIRIKGFTKEPTNNDYFYTFDENFQKYGKGTSVINYFLNRYSQWLRNWPTATKFEMGEDGVGMITLNLEELDKVSNTYPPILRESKWIRFNVTYATPENFIITFDEEIK